MASRWQYAQVTHHQNGSVELESPILGEVQPTGSLLTLLNTLGQAGWELVSCVHARRSDAEVYTLKREVAGFA